MGSRSADTRLIPPSIADDFHTMMYRSDGLNVQWLQQFSTKHCPQLFAAMIQLWPSCALIPTELMWLGLIIHFAVTVILSF